MKNEGFIGLYRGIVPGLWLVSNGAIQFMAYEQLRTWTIKYIANNQESNLSSPHFFVMGACSKMFSTAITYPLQVTKARLYTKEPGSSKPRYKSVLDVWKRTISGEGIRGFYNGLTLQLFKTAPASALTFVAYENILRFLNPDN